MSSVIRVAVIGAGHWGPSLIRNFTDSQRSEVAWVVDTDPKRLDQVRARYPGVETASDAARAIDDPSVHAVVVATPTITHHALARRALAADKHVLVEKPLATSSAECTELAELAASRNRVLLVGHVFLYNAAVRKVRQYIESDELGRIYYVSMVRTNLGPIRMDVNASWDLAAHDISIASYWLAREPIAASAVGGNWINPGIADAVFATLRYPDDVLVNLHVSWLNPRKGRDITVVGERRMLTFDDMSVTEPVRVFDKQVTADETRPSFIDSYASFRASVREGDIVIPRVGGPAPLTAEVEHFLDCVQGKATPLTDGRFGASVVRALTAIDHSVREQGREVPVAST